MIASRPKYSVCMVSLHPQRHFTTHLLFLPGVAELKFDVSDPIIPFSLHISPRRCWLIELVFYGPSTHFRSFRARSVALFLGKPSGQFTNI